MLKIQVFQVSATKANQAAAEVLTFVRAHGMVSIPHRIKCLLIVSFIINDFCTIVLFVPG